MQIKNFIINENESVKNAMKSIDINSKGIVFIVDKKNQLLGSLTDGDIRRWLLKGGELETIVSKICNPKPYFVFEYSKQKAKELINENKLTAVPVLSDNRNIINIIFSDSVIELERKIDLPVVIMAGGKGRRLKPYTDVIPKPLIPIGDLSIVERIMHGFNIFGASDFKMLVNYKKSLIKAYFSDIDVDYNLEFIDEEIPLGTGGGLSKLKGKVKTDFILTNCDILIDANINYLVNKHREDNNFITIVAAVNETIIPYGVIQSDHENGQLSIFEKPKISNLVNTGVYVVNKKVIEDLEDNRKIDFPEIISNYLSKGYKIGVFPISDEDWHDMGQLGKLANMKTTFGV
mgnify:CR=1 FL=1